MLANTILVKRVCRLHSNQACTWSQSSRVCIHYNNATGGLLSQQVQCDETNHRKHIFVNPLRTGHKTFENLNITFNSIMANFVQYNLPAENGIKAYGCLLTLFSGKNLYPV